jgi:hypothetical protein
MARRHHRRFVFVRSARSPVGQQTVPDGIDHRLVGATRLAASSGIEASCSTAERVSLSVVGSSWEPIRMLDLRVRPGDGRWSLTVDLASEPDATWTDMFLNSPSARMYLRGSIYPSFERHRISVEFPSGRTADAVRFVEESIAYANRVYGSTVTTKRS